MKDNAEKLFLHELETQCRLALLSEQDMNAVLAAETWDVDRFWLAIQSFVAAAANLSKAFYPAKGGSKIRAQALREKLGVDDQSPLADRAVRNCFEHWDERLDDWITSSRSVFMHRNVGSPNFIGNLKPSDHFSFYDSKNRTIWYMGRKLDVDSVVTEVERLQGAIARELQH